MSSDSETGDSTAATTSNATAAKLPSSEKLRLVMRSTVPAGLIGFGLALLHLWLSQPETAILSAGLFTPFAALALYQLLLGVVWMRQNEEHAKSEIWSLALALSSMSSGALWGYALSHMLQAADVPHLLLVAPAGAVLLFGLHFTALGVHLLLFVTALLGGLLMTGVGAAPISPSNLAMLGLSGFLTTAALLVMYILSTRLGRIGREQNFLKEENAMLQERSSKLFQDLQESNEKYNKLKEALTDAKQVAQAADVKKNEFMATMSHEIRTPLNGILPLLEMLGESRLDKEQKKLVNTAYNSSRHLLRIINDILDFSKIEAGKLELEEVELSLDTLIESVTSLMGNMAEKRKIKISRKISRRLPGRLRGDPLRLRQIISNLLSNAIKFTEEGTISVEAALSRTAKRDVEVLFTVRDTGVGMDNNTVRRLFSSFTQADASTTRKYGGTGLGLAICKRLVNLMGGQIGVRSKVGKGSIFWFVIPMRRPLDEVPAGRESLEEGRCLLVGFDDEDFRDISSHLKSWGVVFNHVDDAQKALSALNSAANLGGSWVHDAMIFDHARLGKHSSRALIAEIKGSLHIGQTATIAVLGNSDEGAELLEMGVSDVLTKPLRRTQLHQMMCRLLDVQDDQRRESELLKKADSVTPMLEQDILDHGEADSEPSLSAEESAPARQEPSKNILEGGYVLLVEDNEVNRTVAKRLLEKMGIQVDEAVDGVQAVERAEENAYDLVLMDCRMPNKDGYEATGEIRDKQQRGELDAMPVIAMTANAMAGDRQKCIDAGMDDYLSKPVNFATLQEMMSKWMRPKKKRAKEATTPNLDKAKGKPMSNDTEIDMNIINELKDVMEDEFTGLLQSYVNNITPLYTELRNAAVADQIDGMVNPAHSIKSSSANVGAMKVSEAAKSIEMAARNNDGDTAKKAFQVLNKVLPPAVKSLNAIIAENK